MAHFAQIDSNNVVLQVIVVSNYDINNAEPLTIQQAKEIPILAALGGDWVQTSFNNNFRGNFAGQGFTYHADLDIFMPPQPYPSWLLDAQNATWLPPIPYPTEGGDFIWNEENQAWEAFE